MPVTTTISLTLKAGGNALANQSMRVGYSLAGKDAWTNIGTVTTNNNGDATLQTTVLKRGVKYDLRSIYAGEALPHVVILGTTFYIRNYVP